MTSEIKLPLTLGSRELGLHPSLAHSLPSSSTGCLDSLEPKSLLPTRLAPVNSSFPKATSVASFPEIHGPKDPLPYQLISGPLALLLHSYHGGRRPLDYKSFP